MYQLTTSFFLGILLVSGSLLAQQHKSTQAAPSQGNKQDTSVLIVEPQRFPFCNLTESDHTVTEREFEAKNVPALLAPKVCGDQDNWDLASDPFMHSPFWTGKWNTDPAVWKRGSKPADACLAGKADIVLERSFRYGFCDSTLKNVDRVDVPAASFSLNDADYYIFNIVVWDFDGTHYSVTSSKWYVYNHGDHGKWYRQQLSTFSDSLRVYGSKKPIGFVAIHIRPSSAKWKDFSQIKVKYTIAVTGKTAANAANFLAALEIIGSAAGVAAAKQDPEGFYGATFFKAKFPSDISFSASVEFPKTQTANTNSLVPPRHGVSTGVLPIGRSGFFRSSDSRWPILNKNEMEGGAGNARELLAVFRYPLSLNLLPAAVAQKKDNTSQPKAGDTSTNSSTTPQVPVGPSADCPGQTSGGQQPNCTFAATVDDEDLYHWDISFAVPFRTMNDLQFSSAQTSGNTVVTKTVTRLNAYVLFEWFPIAADIKTPPPVAVPHLLAGLPISGKVFNKPLFGGGDTLNLRKLIKIVPFQVGFFGGVIFNKEFRQIPGTTGASNVAPHRVWKGSYGIEIPVSQFKSLLSSNKAQNSTNSTQKTSSTGGGK
jgi:hypothetical protein